MDRNTPTLKKKKKGVRRCAREKGLEKYSFGMTPTLITHTKTSPALICYSDGYTQMEV